MLNRRELLALGGVVGGAALIPSGLAVRSASSGAEATHGGHTLAAASTGTATPATPFSVRMPIPPVLEPVFSRFGVDYYRLPVRATEQELMPGVRTPVLTFGGSFVGPTIRARAGRRVKLQYVNQLGTPANVHLHGAHTAPQHDGHPMDLVQPGASRLYEYGNEQEGATLWYHDHTHHAEAEQVYRGLHGFYLIEREEDRRLRLPDGHYDVPIMMCDARFDEAGGLVYSPFDFERPVLLVNGRPQPFFPVAGRRYRFRLLNASTHRVLQLNLGGASLVQVASDGGLLPEPVELTELALGPAERAEVVVDFGRHPLGTQLVLSDSALGPVLRFDVTRRAHDDSQVPDRLRVMPRLAPATNTRELTLSTDFVNITSLIDGKLFDATRVDARIPIGSTEIWKINNVDTDFGGVNHTFHLHLVQFRVLDRDGAPPPANERGWKDTVLIRPGTSVRVQATFHGYTGRYVYHCHMLEHSSFGMMAQMEVHR